MRGLLISLYFFSNVKIKLSIWRLNNQTTYYCTSCTRVLSRGNACGRRRECSSEVKLGEDVASCVAVTVGKHIVTRLSDTQRDGFACYCRVGDRVTGPIQRAIIVGESEGRRVRER